MSHVLKRDTRCCVCHEVMKSGEPFKWNRVVAGSGSKVSSLKHAWRQSHPAGARCLVEKVRDEQEADRKRGAALVMASLHEHGASAEVTAAVKRQLEAL